MKFTPLGIINPTPKPVEIPIHERKDFHLIVLGGMVLAGCAGFVNICSILTTTVTVSHNTGIFTRMSQQFGSGEIKAALYKMLVLFCYLLGSAFVGFFIQKEKFYLTRKYGMFFMLESLLLFIVARLYDNDEHTYSVLISSFAMGLQNGLFTNFSGAVVRTTHVTGLLTDVGLIIGHFIRGKEQTTDLWRLKVLVPLMIGFFCGGFLGGICHTIFDHAAMYFPAVILGSAGTFWTVVRIKNQMNKKPKYNSNYELV